MAKKILLIGGGVLLLLALLVFFVLIPGIKTSPSIDANETALSRLVNSIAYSTVSELKTEADYKKVWEDAEENMIKQKSFEMSMENLEDMEEGSIRIKIRGEDVGMYLDYKVSGEDMNMTIVRKGDYAYFGTSEEGVKTRADSESTQELLEDYGIYQFRESLREPWDGEDMQYKGLETIGSRKYHTYYSMSDATTTWIDALAILPVQSEDDSGGKGTISYKRVSVDAPKNYEDISDLSEEEQQEKIFEKLFTAMFADFEDEDWEMEDFDFDEEWDMEDWDFDDEDFDFDWDEEDLD